MKKVVDMLLFWGKDNNYYWCKEETIRYFTSVTHFFLSYRSAIGIFLIV